MAALMLVRTLPCLIFRVVCHSNLNQATPDQPVIGYTTDHSQYSVSTDIHTLNHADPNPALDCG